MEGTIAQDPEIFKKIFRKNQRAVSASYSAWIRSSVRPSG